MYRTKELRINASLVHGEKKGVEMEDPKAELMGIIKGRRNIRKYRDIEVPNGLLYRLLESLQWCPSWDNRQCWEIIVIRNKAEKHKLQETVPKNSPSWDAVAQAPILLVLGGKPHGAGYSNGRSSAKVGDWFMFDSGIATQALSSTARDLGLGTVIVGNFDRNKAKKILGVPKDFEVVTIIPVGYPAIVIEVYEGREVSDYTHFESY